MDKDNILELFKDCDFDHLSEATFEENIVCRLPQDFHFIYKHGISKCVLLPIDKPYVIKVPFEGTYDEYYVYKAEENNPELIPSIDFYYFDYANTDSRYNWDYCFTEAILYNYAKQNNINHLFCKTRRIGAIDRHPIYIQERATVFSDTDKMNENPDKDNPSETEVRSTSLCEENKVPIFNTIWLTDAFLYYGEKTFKRFLRFLSDYEINDLHTDNVGYIGKKPVLIDYSGWKEY